ncbi:hypothetical protein [Flavobacterium geliluteum]|uniref:Uncharacterized protein n=1 Tax=Flavobacterium geliluteum TaxID=2816120 RepID=A0A941B0C8_9FLAO|nr:hypothetical protein [Flavobacterium geliluteum]MBP4140022.1 hypothetical protein [Flavobacterium geliluteum]
MKIAEHYTTSDGQEFYKEDTARNHAKTLSNKKVTTPGEEIKEIDVNDIEVDGEELVADATGTDATGTDAIATDAKKEIKSNTKK